MTKKNMLAVLMIVFLCFSSALATIYYVGPDGCDDDPGTSWVNAFETLTYALSQASSDDEIWVAAGTYTPGTTRPSTFQMVSGVDVYGGFNGTETTRSQRDWVNNVTILSGDIGTASDTDNCYHVVTGGVSNASLDGFTITKGYADGTAPNCLGAGLFNPIDLYNCIFENNYASGSGGALWLDGNCEIINCIFRNNSTDGAGGAVHLYMANVTFANDLFYGNTADDGGALYIDYSNPSIVNCTFSQNEVDGDGGALYFAYCSTSVDVENCILWGNSATGSGDQAFKYFAGIAPTYTYCDIQDCYDASQTWDTSLGTNGSNNIDIAPEFIGADNGEFHINSDSPCIDAGDNDAVTGYLYDLDCHTRVMDGPDLDTEPEVDMGCYEYSNVIYVDLDAVGNNDGFSWANAYNNIQAAINAAQSGDEIWVADGTYTLTSTINVTKQVSIYGGFQGNSRSGGGETSMSQRNFRTYETIVDGDESYRCFMVTEDATIDGFEIKDGKTAQDDTNGGAGIRSNACSLIIENCIFNGNEIHDENIDYNPYSEYFQSVGGAGIYFDNGESCSLIITSCEFKNNIVNTLNKGARGSAVYTVKVGPKIVNCLFYNNTSESLYSESLGGAILFNHMEGASNDAEVINCTFYNNSGIRGAGIYVSKGKNTITNNQAVITNSIFWNQTDNEIYLAWGVTANVTYCQLNHSAYPNSTTTHNNNANPNFTNISTTPYDFTLASNSPCVDTGFNDDIDDYDEDLAGNTRIVDGPDAGTTPTVDRGCYEYQYVPDP